MLSSNGYIILRNLLSEMARSDATLPHPAIGLLENGVQDCDIPQDVQSVLYRYYLLMNLLVTASQLADEVQAGSIPPPEDPQAVLG